MQASLKAEYILLIQQLKELESSANFSAQNSPGLHSQLSIIVPQNRENVFFLKHT
jgi:hypothetical protein